MRNVDVTKDELLYTNIRPPVLFASAALESGQCRMERCSEKKKEEEEKEKAHTYPRVF